MTKPIRKLILWSFSDDQDNENDEGKKEKLLNAFRSVSVVKRFPPSLLIYWRSENPKHPQAPYSRNGLQECYNLPIRDSGQDPSRAIIFPLFFAAIII